MKGVLTGDQTKASVVVEIAMTGSYVVHSSYSILCAGRDRTRNVTPIVQLNACTGLVASFFCTM